MNKAVFLDRDGTIIVDKHYAYKTKDMEFLPGALDGLKLLHEAGFLLVLITNQSGIARGYFTEKDYIIFESFFERKLHDNGSSLSKSYFCPHLPNAKIDRYSVECLCRKPQLGLFYKAVKELDLDIASCYSIGDKMRDNAICLTTECNGYLVGTSENHLMVQCVINKQFERIHYVPDLLTAACEISAKALKRSCQRPVY